MLTTVKQMCGTLIEYKKVGQPASHYGMGFNRGASKVMNTPLVIDEDAIQKIIVGKYWDTLEFHRDILELHAKDCSNMIATALATGKIVRREK